MSATFLSATFSIACAMFCKENTDIYNPILRNTMTDNLHNHNVQAVSTDCHKARSLGAFMVIVAVFFRTFDITLFKKETKKLVDGNPIFSFPCNLIFYLKY